MRKRLRKGVDQHKVIKPDIIPFTALLNGTLTNYLIKEADVECVTRCECASNVDMAEINFFSVYVC